VWLGAQLVIDDVCPLEGNVCFGMARVSHHFPEKIQHSEELVGLIAKEVPGRVA
jgi:hypothetical protein